VDEAEFLQLFAAWDEVDAAMRRVSCSLPWQMSESIKAMEEAQAAMTAHLRNYALQKARSAMVGDKG
jgi:hypothetical protein